MKINAKITLLINQDGLHLTMDDDDAVICFLDVRLTPQQTVEALSRLAHVPCECEVRGLNLVGKKRLSQKLSFEFAAGHSYGEERQKLATSKAKEVCPEGWKPDTYFGSQNSFSYNHDTGVTTAHTTAYKWVDIEKVTK